MKKKLTSNCGIVNFWAHSQSTISQSHTFCESGKISMRNKRKGTQLVWHKWYISWLRIYASEMCMILPSVSWIIFSSFSYHLIFVGVFSYLILCRKLHTNKQGKKWHQHVQGTWVRSDMCCCICISTIIISVIFSISASCFELTWFALNINWVALIRSHL